MQEIAKKRGGLDNLLNLNIDTGDVKAILAESGFSGYRLDGALEWILKTMDMVRGI